MPDTIPPSATSELIELLSLERLEDNLFRGQSRDIGTKYVFGGQVLTLQINRDLGAANVFGNGGGIGPFTVNYPACYPSSTPTVNQVLADLNVVLSGGANPTACSVSALNNLADQLNRSFDNCVAGPTAIILNPPAPPQD